MSTSLIASYTYASQQVLIYTGTAIFLAGVIGGILHIIVLLSLRTFRENSCAFYLTIMSMVNLGYLLVGLFPRLLTIIYNVDGSENVLFYCKFRPYFTTVCSTISLTCFCLATMDQYCATSSRICLQRWSNIKLAQRLSIIFIIIWILHATPNLVLYNHMISPVTNRTICTMTNAIYIQYRAYVISLTFGALLPLFILLLFGSMAYYNVKQMAYYTVPLVRRELDKQLTTMILTQSLVNFLTILPFTIVNLLQFNPNLNNNSLIRAQMQLAYNITLVILYSYYSNAFYIHFCASERFRRQLFYVLFKIYCNRCPLQARIVNNQVAPTV